MPDPDVQSALGDVYNDVLSSMKEIRKSTKSAVKRPADPHATRVSPAERDLEYDRLISDPAAFSSAFGTASARYNLPKEKPIPRKRVEQLVAGYKRARP